MRYLLPVIAILLCLTSCFKKAQEPRHCYVCTRIDSIYSNIPKLAKPAYYTVAKNVCDMTDADKNVYADSHTHGDTSYYSNDTVVISKTHMECILNY